MAALQKVRNWSKFLIGIVGLALFAFIAEELVRSLSYRESESRQRIGSIYGENVSLQDFNALVDEYTDVLKTTQGMANLTDEQMQSVRDQVWQTYVQNKLIAHEAEKLGLTVTDKELQNIIETGSSQILMQTPFRTKQGTFDAAALRQFLQQYDELMSNDQVPAETKEQYTAMYNYWKFIEKTVRQQTLSDKYQSLLASCIISNPIAAKQSYEARINTSDALVAALPYTTIQDNTVKPTDDELKAKYEEVKELFRNTQELRDIKYIDVAVKASEADIKSLDKDMAGYAQQLATGEPAKVVREAQSLVSYSPLPVSRKSLPSDIAGRLDSMTVGQQVGPYYNGGDNTLNIIRLISKVSRPDSVEVRQIALPGTDMAKAEKSADSIIAAVNGGAPFDSIAKKYGQPAQKQWITSAQYEGQSLDENNQKFITAITTATAGSTSKIVLDGQGIIVANVTDVRGMEDKYDVAVIKTTREFSKDTYNRAFNDFSAFLAGKNAEQIEAEAQKAGYSVETRQAISSAEHTVANVNSTREAMRWIFNEDTKIGDVSPLYECGDNDHLLCIILTGINPEGYFAWDNEQVKQYLTSEVIKDKKAARLQEKMKNAKNIAEVQKMPGAVTDTLRNVNFAQTAFVAKTGAMEPALTGSITAQKQGAFKAGIKGQAAVYAYDVLKTQKQSGVKFDKKAEEEQLCQMSLRGLGNYAQDLYNKAKVVDHRYLFY